MKETFHNDTYEITVAVEGSSVAVKLLELRSGTAFADGDYRYQVHLDDGTTVTHLDGLSAARLTRRDDPDRTTFEITGQMGAGKPLVRVRHVITAFPAKDYLEETVALSNVSQTPLTLRDWRMGFRRDLTSDDLEEFTLFAVPFTTQPDGKKHAYSTEDLRQAKYQTSAPDANIAVLYSQKVWDQGRGRSEAWALSDGASGLLIVKYNPNSVEYSVVETESHRDRPHLIAGGAAPTLYIEPNEIRRLEPGQEIQFGVTRYVFYQGPNQQAYYAFRDYMTSLGHGIPQDYNPPVNWNELFDVGWYHSDPEKLKAHYTPQALLAEAAKASEIGCDLLYLDPGWEVCEGTTTWDEERLGLPEEFVHKIKEEYALEVGLRVIGRSYSDAYPGMYRRNYDGTAGYFREYLPDTVGALERHIYEPCTQYSAFFDEKARRILKLADCGIKFIMFDEFDWRGPCFDPAHGHPVPTTPADHARSIMGLIQKVHERHPEILIEAHDPIWPWGVRYLPVYFLHDLPGSFDEGWAFEFMWNPIEDLVSGRALCLYYYNLAYDLPQYNHITMENDNDNCLAFWWYASTVRHLGIGGKKGLTGTAENQRRFDAYKQAMKTYRALKDFYTRGKFIGIDELTHVHVLGGRAVLNAFNLTASEVQREVTLDLPQLGLPGTAVAEGASFRREGTALIIGLRIPAMSPVVVPVSPKEGS